MGTSYSTIYDAYFNKVTDDLYTAMDAEELEQELQKILEAALPRFLYPKKPLDRDEEGFIEELNNDEIQIIATLMNLVWAESKLSDVEVTRQVFRDNDFQLTSQASHLRALVVLKDNLKDLCRELMHSYSKVKDRRPDFSGLARGSDNV